jgi:hypothetical protein
VIVANLEDFKHWTGSNPLPVQERERLHLWGAFTHELPEKFRPEGPAGHQFVPAGSLPELLALREELLRYIKDRWPRTAVSGDMLETSVVRRRDGKQLQVHLEPTGEYDRCIRDLYDLKLHTFDGGRRCVVFSVVPGLVDIHKSASARRLELSQTFFLQDEKDERQPLERVRGISLPDAGPGPTFEVTDGPVVISWAPNSYGDQRGELKRPALDEPGMLLDLATGGSGALLSIELGSYRIAHGEEENSRWGVRWCVLEAASPGASQPPAEAR